MANPFVKSWKYFMSWFGAKVDERADPKIQIQQAIEEAQRGHSALTQQAAQVIGNQRQLEMKLSNKMSQVERLQAQTRQALVLADKEKQAGNAEKAADFEQTAQTLANTLVTEEQQMTDLKNLHDQSVTAAAQARKAVEQNESMLKQKLAERTKLLSQLEQAKMQERVSASLQQVSQLAAPGNVPSLAEVQDKIERRYATALGQAELASTSVEGRMLEVERSTMDMAGSARLEEIRASIAGEITAGDSASTPAIEPGATAQAADGNSASEVGGAPATPAAEPQADQHN